MTVDPGDRLRHLLMLGRWTNQRAAIDRAIQAVPTDQSHWADTGIATSTWAATVGKQLTDEIPTLIKESGWRPARAVTAMIRSALCFGIEVGRQLERQEQGR